MHLSFRLIHTTIFPNFAYGDCLSLHVAQGRKLPSTANLSYEYISSIQYLLVFLSFFLVLTT